MFMHYLQSPLNLFVHQSGFEVSDDVSRLTLNAFGTWLAAGAVRLQVHARMTYYSTTVKSEVTAWKLFCLGLLVCLRPRCIPASKSLHITQGKARCFLMIAFPILWGPSSVLAGVLWSMTFDMNLEQWRSKISPVCTLSIALLLGRFSGARGQKLRKVIIRMQAVCPAVHNVAKYALSKDLG